MLDSGGGRFATAALATHMFSDVDDGRFYAEPVRWAADNEMRDPGNDRPGRGRLLGR